MKFKIIKFLQVWTFYIFFIRLTDCDCNIYIYIYIYTYIYTYIQSKIQSKIYKKTISL